ncbi:DUF917 domain-containing protein [Microbacterium petrolearium]
MELSLEDVEHLRVGALFLACAVDHDQCNEYADRVREMMAATGRGPRVVPLDALPPSAPVVSLGFVMRGLPVTELAPTGDEFVRSLRQLEAAMGVQFAGIFPLAAANINAMVPLLASLQTGLPVVDADPMGRVFPLLSHTTLAAAGEPVGPIAVTGATGESAVVHVDTPQRAERIVRALAAEFGGWAATASYPVSVAALRAGGIPGTVSRLIDLGRILAAPVGGRERDARQTHAALTELVGARRAIRARVTDVEGLARPAALDQPDLPTSVTLYDEARSRVIRLEIQNEILIMMVDGAVEAVVPDVITMLRASDGQVASLEDLWIGNKLDLLSFPAAPQWYEPAALALTGPEAFGVSIGSRTRHA